MKKRYKIWFLVGVLFLLSGCAHWGWVDPGASNVLSSDLMWLTGSTVMEFNLGWFWTVNDILLTMNSTVANGVWGLLENIYYFLSSFTFLGTMMGIINIISVGFIMIKFAWVVFKNYFLNIDGQHAVPTMDFFKRILYSLLLVFLAPYLVITAFVSTSVVAASTGVAIFKSTEPDTELVEQFHKDSKEYGISLKTYCYENILADTEFKDNYKNKDSLINNSFSSNAFVIAKTRENQAIIGGTRYLPTGDAMTSLYNTYCEGAKYGNSKGYRIGQNIIYNPEYAKGWPNPEFMGEIVAPDEDGQAPNVFMILLIYAASALFGLVAIFMTANRIADIISSLVMLWYFAAATVTEGKNRGVEDFFRQIISACVTNMYTIFTFSIFVTFMATTPAKTFETLIMMFALYTVMRKGSSMVQSLLTPSGAGDQLSKAASTGNKALGG